jgi:hypothetical protein
MNITANDVFEAQQHLSEAGGIEGLPIALRVRIAKGIRAIKAAAEPLAEVSQSIALEHAEKDQDGKPVAAGGGYLVRDAAAYRAAIRDLGKLAVVVDLEPIKLSEIKDSKISANALAALHFWFVDG